MAGTLAQLLSQRWSGVEWVVRDYMLADPKARHMPKITITNGPPPDSLHPPEQRKLLPRFLVQAAFPSLPEQCDMIIWPEGTEKTMDFLCRFLHGSR